MTDRPRPTRYVLHVMLPPQAPTRFSAECRCGWTCDPVGSAAVASALWDRHATTCPEFEEAP